MREYSSKEKKYLLGLKERLMKGHKKCNGFGYIENKDGIETCKCMIIFEYIKELYYSRIPLDYWELELNSLEVKSMYKKITNTFIKNIDNALEQGLGMIFLGDKGIGKTSLMCEIGKAAIVKRYNVFYVLVQHVIDDKFTEEQNIMSRMLDADLIILDELDKVMMRDKSNIPKQLDTTLKALLPYNKSFLIGTNLESENEIEDKLQLLSLIKRYMKIIPMEGSDYSDKKQEKWLKRLTDTKIDFFCDNILNMANEFFNNQNIAYEKEYDELF